MTFSCVRKTIVFRIGQPVNVHDCLEMDLLSAFGLSSVTAMLLFYALEERSPWFVAAFSVACGLASVYGFLQGAWPFGLIEAIWMLVALRRWQRIR